MRCNSSAFTESGIDAAEVEVQKAYILLLSKIQEAKSHTGYQYDKYLVDFI